MTRIKKMVTSKVSPEYPAAKIWATNQSACQTNTKVKRVNIRVNVQKKLCAKAIARARPSSLSTWQKTGIKALDIAPSAERRRNRLGSEKASTKASEYIPVPKAQARTISRSIPKTRLRVVITPTVPTERA